MVVPLSSSAAYVAAPVPAAMTRAAAPAEIFVIVRFIGVLSEGVRVNGITRLWAGSVSRL